VEGHKFSSFRVSVSPSNDPSIKTVEKGPEKAGYVSLEVADKGLKNLKEKGNALGSP